MSFFAVPGRTVRYFVADSVRSESECRGYEGCRVGDYRRRACELVAACEIDPFESLADRSVRNAAVSSESVARSCSGGAVTQAPRIGT